MKLQETESAAFFPFLSQSLQMVRSVWPFITLHCFLFASLRITTFPFVSTHQHKHICRLRHRHYLQASKDRFRTRIPILACHHDSKYMNLHPSWCPHFLIWSLPCRRETRSRWWPTAGVWSSLFPLLQIVLALLLRLLSSWDDGLAGEAKRQARRWKGCWLATFRIPHGSPFIAVSSKMSSKVSSFFCSGGWLTWRSSCQHPNSCYVAATTSDLLQPLAHGLFWLAANPIAKSCGWKWYLKRMS
jgi:hypothetical protein